MLTTSRARRGFVGLATITITTVFGATARSQGTEWHRLDPNSGKPQMFGHAVATDGNVAVIGDPIEYTNGSGSGSVYVFAWNATRETWSQVQQLFPSTPGVYWNFGESVAIDGDTLVVGADSESAGSLRDEGATYVFRRDSGTGSWTETARLVSSTPAAQGFFGCSVAVEGDVVVVGALGEVDPSFGVRTGAVHVFRRDSSGAYPEEAVLYDPSGTDGMFFGVRTVLRGDTLAASASRNDGYGYSGRYAVDIFRHSSGTWAHVQRFDSDVKEYGQGLSLDGDSVKGTRLAIGSPWDNDIGAIHVHRHDGTAFVHEATLTPPANDQDRQSQFGVAVAVRGDFLVGGKPVDDYVGPSNWIGTAHTYRYARRSGWVDDVKLQPKNAAPNGFGTSIAIGEEEVLLGAFSQSVVYTYPVDELVVNVDPDAPAPDTDAFTTALFGGTGDLLVIAIVGVDGTPMFIPVVVDVFGGDHRFSYYFRTPPAPLGITLDVQAYEVSPTGRLVASDVETVTL